MSTTRKNDELPEESAETTGEAAPEAEESSPAKASRFDDAKAFFRALNAGADLNASETDTNMSGSSPATATSCHNCEQAINESHELAQKLNEVDTLYKRMAADFENYRRRSDREREELLQLGVKRMVESLLPALDDIDRAQQSLNHSMPTEKLLESLKVVFNSLARCLDLAGIKAMEAVGQPFDPRLHEPVQQMETSDFPDGYVMQELRRGYLLGDKVVRQALVNVASNKDNIPDTIAELPTGTYEEKPVTPAQEEKADDESLVYDLTDVDESVEKTVEQYLEKLSDTDS